MTDKQIIIDYKNLCDYYSREVGCYATFDGRCTKEQCSTYKLLQKLQAKEQECEMLKKIINEAKNSKLDLKSFLVGEAVQNEYEQQLDQLKEQLNAKEQECERLKKQLDFQKNMYECARADESDKFEEILELKQTLSEIKEIAEFSDRPYKHCGEYNDCCEIVAKILSKISEVENV